MGWLCTDPSDSYKPPYGLPEAYLFLRHYLIRVGRMYPGYDMILDKV